MQTPEQQEVTALLLAWNEGDSRALERLTPLVYGELRRLARHYMRRERVGHSLQTTGLIHEAYLRLIDASQVQWQNRAHFFAVSARLMRRILVDAARERGYQKRGGGAHQVELDEAMAIGDQCEEELLALDEALNALAEIDARKAQVIELRFFGGLSVEETAEALHVSTETIKRDLRLAKSWLRRRMSE
jgi:RNA polymerase sigma factor (TIGR02999 family)